MAKSDKETIELRHTKLYDGNKKEGEMTELFIDNCRRANVSTNRAGRVTMSFGIAGPLEWQEAKVILQGLLELSVIADQLELGVKRVKKTK